MHTALEALWLNDCPRCPTSTFFRLLGNRRDLDLSGSSLGCGLERLVREIPNVEMLRLDHTGWVRDLAPLAMLSLRNLSLWGCPAMEDLTPLAEQSQLDYLDLEGASVSDLTPLAGLRELETLWLARCFARQRPNAAGRVAGAQGPLASSQGCSGVSDLAPLAELPKLRYLHVQGIAPGVDLAPLAGNRQLTVHIYAGQDVRERLGSRVMVTPSPE